MKIRYRVFAINLLIFILVAALNVANAQTSKPDAVTKPTIVIVHGAWGGSWAFRHVEALSVMSLVGSRGDFLKQMTKGDYVVPVWVKPDQPPPHDVPQSLKTFTEPISLKNKAALKLPVTYILYSGGG